MKHSLSLVVFLAVLGLAATAPAALSDFKIKDQIKLAGQPGRLAVTPDNRFVLILDQTNKAIDVLDTWDFSLKPDRIAPLSAAPVSITLNPSGTKAYVSLASGKVAVVDISTLGSLGFDQPLSSLTTPPSVIGSVTVSSTALGDIAAMPMSGVPNDSCVFVINGNTLDSFKESAPGTVAGLTPLDCNAREVEGGGKFMFLLCDNPTTAKADLRQYECTAAGPSNATVTAFAVGARGDFRGLSLAPDKTFLLLGDTIAQKLLLVNVSPTVVGIDTVGTTPFSIGIKMQDVLATEFAAETGPIAFAGDTTDLVLAQGNSGPTAFTGDTVIPLPKAGGGFLAQGSTIDQYVYLSLAGGETVAVVTANPWVDIISVLDATTASAGNTVSKNVKFQSDLAGTYNLYLGNSFSPAGSIKNGSILANTPVTVTVSNIPNGSSVITVKVTTSDSRTGRNAAAVSANLGPVPQNFSLDFGTGKLIISYTVQNRRNLDRQEIYYGTDCSVPLDGYTLIDNNPGDQGRPPSPITVIKPAAGKDIRKVVEGVQNGSTYCVQIATFDTSGRSSISARQSIKVEKTFTLTKLTGEKGGFACFGLAPSGQGFRGSGAWLAATPGMVLLLLRIKRRWRRNR
jgi:hypothetical protein